MPSPPPRWAHRTHYSDLWLAVAAMPVGSRCAGQVMHAADRTAHQERHWRSDGGPLLEELESNLLMPVPLPADVSGMRSAWGRIICGCSAVLALGVGLSVLDGIAQEAGASPKPDRSSAIHQTIVCDTALHTSAPLRRSAAADGRHHEKSRENRPSKLTVAIPSTVFIRKHGKKLVVTTNTQMHPKPGDGYYLVAAGRAQSADAALQKEVLAACNPAPPRSEPQRSQRAPDVPENHGSTILRRGHPPKTARTRPLPGRLSRSHP